MTEDKIAPEGKVTKKLKIEVVKPENFKQTYAIGALGGHSPYDLMTALKGLRNLRIHRSYRGPSRQK